jgi:predicted ATPase/transcriptional regulator with XRE-family HTH domain
MKKRRKSLDLTQAELAKRVGCATISIQLMEAGKRRPSRQMAELLARQLAIPNKEYEEFIKFARAKLDEHTSGLTEHVGHRVLWNLFSQKLTNLPAQTTPLIGRDQDVMSARKRLLDENIRLLTFIGPPGVGKTRLAVQIALGLADEFEDGVHFVPLALINDPNLVPAIIAQTLGVNQVGEQSFTHRLKEYVRDKHILLLLDNFEQVVTSAPFIAELLSACPWLSLLVTSRVPLSIRGEHLFPVMPLTLPEEEAADVNPSDLLDYSAIELFVERAQAVKPDLELDSENSRTIAAICARLDGLPLAIELVSARTGFLPLHALLDQIGEGHFLHTNGLRDVTNRHHTLYHAINWSYNLLIQEQQLLLARLSVFIGGWTLEAVERIMEDRPAFPTLECLMSLVENNVVTQHEQHGMARFSMLETIHEFASEKLLEIGEEQDTRQRHAEYYLELAEQAEPHLRTETQQVWLERLDVERGNFRAALSWFVDNIHDIEKGMRLAGALGWFWNMRGYVSEGRIWLERVLTLENGVKSSARVKVLNAAGSLAWAQGNLTNALTCLEEAIILARELGPAHTWDLAFALGNHGNVVMYLKNVEALQRSAEEAHALFTCLGDSWGMGLSLLLIGEVHLLKHDHVRACSCFEEASVMLRKTGDKWATGISLMDWGYAESLLGDLASARAHLEESIALHMDIGERIIRSMSLNILAQIVQQQEDTQSAMEYYAESLDLLRKMGIEESIADVQYNLACFVHAQGHDQLAKRLYNECLGMFSKQGNEEGIVKCQAGLAMITNGNEAAENKA